MAEANVSGGFFISPLRNIAFYIVDVKLLSVGCGLRSFLL
jgi:hypothetical protein